ncbi:chromatin assembly factor 1 subunit B [Perkinsela sp. CCAP 1560/4]|nr:chromatin assembly factor 1 subunit B [Perkinsela sp. CCAP 1560/4]|eukprot:KNH01800.1 chromatin assembly factor 1 subunit B [Perkinsela sp. CCAP 1560/4]
MSALVHTLELRWHFPYDIDSGGHGVLSGKDADRPSPVVSVHWHPFEFKLLTSGFDGSTKIWTFDPSTGLAESIKHFSTMYLHEKSSCNCARWSPDGSTIAAGYNSGEVVLWRQALEKPAEPAANAIPHDHKPESSFRRPTCPTIFPPADGGDAAGAVRSNPHLLHKPKLPAGSAAQTSYNYEYNLEPWSAVKVLRAFGETEVYAVAFSNDGKLLTSGSQEGYFVVHDLEKGYQKLRVDHKHIGPIQGIAWDPFGTYFTTIGADRKCFVYGVKQIADKSPLIHIHDTISRSEQGSWLFRGQDATPFYRHGSFSPDGLMLAVPCGWMGARHEKPSAADDHEPTESDTSPRKEELAPVQSSANNCAYIFLRHIFQKPYRALCMIGDSPVIGAVFSPRMYAPPRDAETETADFARHAPEGTQWGPSEYTMAIAVFSNEIANIFTTSHHAPILQFSEMHLAPITCVGWCYDGRHIAISSDDGACTLASVGDLLLPISKESLDSSPTPLRKIFAENKGRLDNTINEMRSHSTENGVPQQTTCIQVRRKEPVVQKSEVIP